MDKKKELSLTDHLAIERTKLANERTFLAYFRTAFVLLATGLTLLKVDYFHEFHALAWALLALFPLILIFGIIRIFKVRKNIENYYS